MTYTKGIDISHYQDAENYTEDLRKAKAQGYQFAIIKAMDGINLDHALKHNFELAVEANMYVGFYHYFRNNHGVSGKILADKFADTIEPYMEKLNGIMIPPAIDVEITYNKPGMNTYNTVHIEGWLKRMKELFPDKEPGIYTSMYMWDKMTTQPRYIENYWLWLADWTYDSQKENYPHYIPKYGKDIRMWQWGIAGHPQHNWTPDSVAGIKGQCDVDYYLYDLGALKKWAGDSQTPVEPPDKEVIETTPYTAMINKKPYRIKVVIEEI